MCSILSVVLLLQFAQVPVTKKVVQLQSTENINWIVRVDRLPSYFQLPSQVVPAVSYQIVARHKKATPDAEKVIWEMRQPDYLRDIAAVKSVRIGVANDNRVGVAYLVDTDLTLRELSSLNREPIPEMSFPDSSDIIMPARLDNEFRRIGKGPWRCRMPDIYDEKLPKHIRGPRLDATIEEVQYVAGKWRVVVGVDGTVRNDLRLIMVPKDATDGWEVQVTWRGMPNSP